MAVPVYTVIGLAFSVGPSEAWMFRWPLRVVPYFVLPAAVLLAIALAQGLAADHRRRRAAGSALIILGGAYLAEATRPDLVYAHLTSILLVGVLTAAVVAAWLRRPASPRRPRCCSAGCVAVLAFQVAVFPRNTNLNDYRFPTDVTATGAALVPRYPGTMLQVANNGAVVHSPDPAALSSEVMFGNMLQAVGVQAVTSYYGMGFKAFTDSLCIEFNGSVCPDALRRAFEPPAPGAPPLADLLRLETVVVQNDLPGVADFAVPDGWRVAERSAAVTVLRREATLPHPQGRLSDAPVGTVVADDVSAARGEVVRITDGPGGTLTLRPPGLARLHRPRRRRRAAGPPGSCRAAHRRRPGGRARAHVGLVATRVRFLDPRRPARRGARGRARDRPGGAPASLRSSRCGVRGAGRPRRRGARRLALTLGDPERVQSERSSHDRAIPSFRKTPRGKDLVCHILRRARPTVPAVRDGPWPGRPAQGSRGRNAGS